MDISVENTSLFFAVKPIYWAGGFPFQEVIFSCITVMILFLLLDFLRRYKQSKNILQKKYIIKTKEITATGIYKSKIRSFLQKKYPYTPIETLTAEEISNTLHEKELGDVMQEIEEIEYGHKEWTKEKQKHIEAITRNLKDT